MSTALNSVQIPILSNVRVIVRDGKTWKEKYRVQKRNRVTKLALLGIARLFAGEFNNSTQDYASNYFPRYVAFGSGSSAPLVTDSKLQSELQEEAGRQPISQRNIENIRNTTSVKLTMQAYIPVGIYTTPDDTLIREAGLFTDKFGNTCLARVIFSPGIKKDSDDVLDVTWDFNIISYSDISYPTGIEFYSDTSYSNLIDISQPLEVSSVTEIYPKAIPSTTTYDISNIDVEIEKVDGNIVAEAQTGTYYDPVLGDIFYIRIEPLDIAQDVTMKVYYALPDPATLTLNITSI